MSGCLQSSDSVTHSEDETLLLCAASQQKKTHEVKHLQVGGDISTNIMIYMWLPKTVWFCIRVISRSWRFYFIDVTCSGKASCSICGWTPSMPCRFLRICPICYARSVQPKRRKGRLDRWRPDHMDAAKSLSNVSSFLRPKDPWIWHTKHIWKCVSFIVNFKVRLLWDFC